MVIIIDYEDFDNFVTPGPCCVQLFVIEGYTFELNHKFLASRQIMYREFSQNFPRFGLDLLKLAILFNLIQLIS